MAPPVDRILARLGLQEAFTTLAERVSGSELTTLLMELMRRRAKRMTVREMVERYEADRFTGVAPVGYASLRRVEEAAIAAALSRGFEACVLSPLAPFGVHSAIATVDQNKVVTTIRGNEVAADPTNVLALEAAVRRRALLRVAPKSAEVVRLVAAQRVVRAQQLPPGARYFAHFHIAGMVSAGRDTGNRELEAAALVEHLQAHADCALALGAEHVRVALTDFTGANGAALDRARARFERDPHIECSLTSDRTSGAGYYQGLCFKTHATFGGEALEIGDGGVVDWTQQLVGSEKERCFISGLGLDRMATLVSAG